MSEANFRIHNPLTTGNQFLNERTISEKIICRLTSFPQPRFIPATITTNTHSTNHHYMQKKLHVWQPRRLFSTLGAMLLTAILGGGAMAQTITNPSNTAGYDNQKSQLIGVQASTNGPTLVTDSADYHPGSTVHITGAGFAPYESIRLRVRHIDSVLFSNSPSQHQDWFATANATGSFSATWAVDAGGHELGAQLVLKAKGLTSNAGK